MLTLLLKHAHYRVLEAVDGQQALEVARSEHPDLIIADVLLPAMDGYQLVRKLRADPDLSGTRVVFYTALFNEREAVDLAREIGVIRILAKPTEPEKILECVAEVLKGAAAQPLPAKPPTFEEKHLQLLVDKLVGQVKASQQSEELCRLLIIGVKDYAIFMLDAEGRVVIWNEGAQRINGWTAEEIVGQHFSRFFTSEDIAAGHPQHELEIASDQGHFEEEGWRLRKGGERFWADITITALYDDLGRLRGFAKITRDVTERKRQEDERRKFLTEQQVLTEELTATNEELAAQAEELTVQKEELEKLNQNLQSQRKLLETANDDLESFSYSVSHDLRTPIRAIKGFSKMLMEEHAARLDSEGLRLLRVVVDNTKIMEELIDDLLALSRLGRQDVKKTVINLAVMAEQVFEKLKTKEPKRDLRLNVSDLPPCWCDRSLLYQVMENLLANAAKFTRSKKNAIIEVEGKTEGSENIYYVKDNGVGFNEDYIGNLFQPFQRLHRREEYEGTGVGLSIVKRIVQKHGGRVWAEGKVNDGATFYFALPVNGV
ncbi:MAG: PAS domain S-box protein [Deltaproteobacteria bacterium]|nr:MAG: PAS domain S-box protein [Deltaproteobacteria bacterium]